MQGTCFIGRVNLHIHTFTLSRLSYDSCLNQIQQKCRLVKAYLRMCCVSDKGIGCTDSIHRVYGQLSIVNG